ncbi:excalibur calcium-binding domain-containing protein [Arthrobacter sp. L77]|uniref:excalibur calcium-binding domain-containing protein n=1 Tax=Arthrobacter sp. L77 TaxID=1496689 RepID=UPI00068ED488|nr:excalibur calcium-binding domain-containing protein [Arthrobacter sp. L77]
MKVTLKQAAHLIRGVSTLALSALLVGAGSAIPTHAAEGVPFTPAIGLSVAPVTPVGSEATVTVNVDAVAGDEWTDVNGTKAPVAVRVDVYEHDGKFTAPAQVSGPVSSETFTTSQGPGEYTFTPQNVTYVDGAGYTFVASILVADGSNPEYIEQDVSTEYGAEGTSTDYLLAPSLSWTPSAERVERGSAVTTTLKGYNFAGRTLDVETRLAGPFASVDSAWTGIPESIATVVTSFNGTGEVTTEPIVVTEAGIYIWYHAIVVGDVQPIFFTQWKPDGSTPGLILEVTAPAGPAEQPPAPETVAPEPDANIVTGYANCGAAKDAGWMNIEEGQTHYSPALDRDQDGIACETDGSDSAVVIDGGTAQTSGLTSAGVGGFCLMLGALAFGLVRLRRKTPAA